MAETSERLLEKLQPPDGRILSISMFAARSFCGLRFPSSAARFCSTVPTPPSRKKDIPLTKYGELISLVGAYSGVEKRTVRIVMDAIPAIVRQEIASGRRVNFAKLGLFRSLNYKPRNVFVPKTGERMMSGGGLSAKVKLAPFLKRLE